MPARDGCGCLGVVTYAWYRTHTNPEGSSIAAEFIVAGDLVYPVEHANARAAPWYAIVGGLVYPASGHPAGESVSAWFEIVGSMVIPAKGHPDAVGPHAWYREQHSPSSD
jgi:hypothetical protein